MTIHKAFGNYVAIMWYDKKSLAMTTVKRLYCWIIREGHQPPNVSQNVRNVANVFFALEGCLVLGLPQNLFICSDVLRKLWSSPKFKVAFSARPNPDESNEKFEDTEYPVRVLSVEDSRGRFVLIPKFWCDLFLTIIGFNLGNVRNNLRKSYIN